jgi:RNA polymerase sigma-70 factor (sigma-E family)
VEASSAEAFSEFVAGRSRSLLRTAWLLTGDWQLAEDLLQTALAKSYLAWGRIRAGVDPDAYVRRALVTTYLTWWRRRWRGEIPSAELPDQATAYDDYHAADVRECVRRALSELPRRQRAVVVLRYYEDMTEVQTAEALGCSVGTVKTHATRALAHLRNSTSLVGLVTEEPVS